MSTPATILMYGREPHLISTRRMILEASGYKVLTSMDLVEIDRMICAGQVDLLILCHTLSMEECGRALASASSRRPTIKNLVLVTGTSGCSSAQLMDQVFNAMDGPAKLISTVGQLVSTLGSAQTAIH